MVVVAALIAVHIETVRLAVRMHPRACHHEAHNISKQDRPKCVLGTFVYGSSQAWAALLPMYSARLGELVESHREWAPRGLKKLCADQDLLTDLVLSRPARFDRFVTADNWGWRNPKPAAAERMVDSFR